MLSYKDYKKLNESLYGAFNLGLKSANTVGGIVSASSINGTEATIEAQAEEALEEAKKMKKKMESDEESEEDEVEDKVSSEGEESEEGSEDDENDEDSDEDKEEDSDDESDEEDEYESEPKFMKKKAKKEWTEVLADLEAVLEDVCDEEALAEVKKGLDTIKEGVKKGHKKGCDCNFCKSAKAKKEGKDDEGDGEGLTAAQKKLPKALQDSILAKKNKKGDKEEKKCGKYMNEEETAWWKSVNGMLGTEDQKGWDGWTEVGEVATAVRDEQNPV